MRIPQNRDRGYTSCAGGQIGSERSVAQNPIRNRDLPKRLTVASTLKWDQEFESGFLQQPVCLSGEPRGCMRKAPHFGGGLRVTGDVRRDGQAASRDSFALSL